MIAYLLAAGFGTRMQPLTHERPKALVRVAERPLLDYLVDDLVSWEGLEAVHLAVNHRDAAAFRRWAESRRSDLEDSGAALQVHDDGVETADARLGTIGDLNVLLEETGIPDDGALVAGTDSLFRFPLAPLLNHYTGATNRVLALYEPDPARRRKSSLIHIENGRVTRIVDDPTGGDTPWICPAWALLDRDALATVDPYLSEGEPADQLAVFLNRIAREQSLRAIRLPEEGALRVHCNTIDDVERARRLLRDEPRHVVGADRIRQCVRREA